MEVLIAIVRLRRRQSSRDFLSPEDYDLLISTDPVAFAKHSSLPWRSLVSCRTHRGEDSVEAALKHIRTKIHPTIFSRAVPVALCDQPSSSRMQCSPLVCIPIIDEQAKQLELDDNKFQFNNLSQLVNESLNSDSSIDSQSRHMIIRIEEWLSQEQCRDIAFIKALFYIQKATARIRLCVHNPAYNPRLAYFCHSILGQNGQAEIYQKSSELEDAVKKSNTVRAKMLEMEKYDKYQINPIFGAGTCYKRQRTSPAYYAKGRKAICQRKPMQQRSPTEFWEQQFPLHKHAFDGDSIKVQELLNKGHNPNELDNDFWTPLHYCAFYNRFKACEILMTHAKTNVNAVNKTGATALHFAALNGNAYLVELILSHQLVDINIQDIYGKTALELCERVPKPEWQSATYLLRNQLRPNKMEVHLVGGPALQVEVVDSFEATAGELRDNVLKSQELAPTAAGRIFAIWITNNRLSLQLKAEQKVKIHLDKWPEHLEKWGDSIDDTHCEENDKPNIVLRRDARTLLGDEQLLAKKSPMAISLLYGEAEQNFLAGLYPCNEKSYVQLAAIILQRLYGDSQQIDGSVLAHILPRHLIPSPLNDNKLYRQLIQKIQSAHKSFAKTNLVQLQLIFLKYCWSLNVYGCTFFKAFMLMSKPLRGNIQVHVGVNDWGMSLINANTFKQVAALELKNLELKYSANTNFVEVTSRKRDFVATLTTPQAMLINNLLKQLKTKIETAKSNPLHNATASTSNN